MSKEHFKIYKGVFDNRTLNIITELIKKGYIDSIEGLVNSGKEAEIYYGFKNNEKRILKIYRIQNSTFRNLYDYLKQDKRYKNIPKKFNRKIILKWVEKEFRNLLICNRNKINVPFPYVFKENIIIMQFINGRLLKDTKLKNPLYIFKEIKKQIINLLNINFIHCDLSEYNIMIDNTSEQPFLIDFGQAIFFKNINYKENIEYFLKRDLTNIINFFNKRYNLNINLENEFKELKLLINNN